MASVSALTMNIFLPSLPGMAEYFATDYRVMQLSIAIYLGTSAILQILIGPISDKIGRRPVVLWGLMAYMLVTLGCIFAPTATIFLTFRMAQAVIITSMVLSRAIVRDIYPSDKAASMIGFVTMGMSVVPMVGPALGGMLEEHFGWQSNFWVLFGLAGMLFLVVYRDLGETKTSSGKTLIDQFKEYPELLTSPRFWGYTMATALSSGSFFAYLGGAPFVGTVLFDMSPAALGIYFGAPAVGYFAGNFLTGIWSQKFGINKLVLAGSLISTCGPLLSLLCFSLDLGNPITFFSFMTLVGLGNGLTIPSATAGALSVRPHLAGTASGLSGAMMIGIGAVLSAVAGALLSPNTGASPLLLLMITSSALGIVSILAVIWRERQIQG